MPRLGLRTIKTSIAVYFCITISTMFGIDPFYSCIAAVSTLQTSIQSSFVVGRDRMVGSAIGAFFGVIFSYFGQNSSFFTALALLCAIYTITLLNSKGAVNIACIVVIAIMVDPTVTSPIQSGIERLLQTLLGIVIAVIVNVTLFPPKN
ncbi:FUSC family protein [Clostridium tunisiense]|uniref:FUSC family protein n=1 Tax=Clostridium tunisiense TaxID=219748 RepID=UPI0003079F59|nr:aromatic acid exporter family protein [Clostridium tunisiense]